MEVLENKKINKLSFWCMIGWHAWKTVHVGIGRFSFWHDQQCQRPMCFKLRTIYKRR